MTIFKNAYFELRFQAAHMTPEANVFEMLLSENQLK